MTKTFLGLDLGSKRVGVAVSDETAQIASPLTTLNFRGRQQLLSEILQIVEEYTISTIVVGLPKTMKDELGEMAQKVIAHVDWFRAQTNAAWILWDERFTTQEVERLLIQADVSREKRKAVRDSLAAQRILQSYLDHHRLNDA